MSTRNASSLSLLALLLLLSSSIASPHNDYSSSRFVKRIGPSFKGSKRQFLGGLLGDGPPPGAPPPTTAGTPSAAATAGEL